jgi:hypothetical protein
MSVVIDGATGVTAPAFDGAVDAADLTGNVAAARITTALNASGSAPIYACRAWVNFNGSGTVAIRASGNVSSITDNGVGMYTVNFTTAMQDVNYAWSGSAKIDATATGAVTLQGGFSSDQLAASLSIETIRADVISRVDAQLVTIAIFR